MSRLHAYIIAMHKKVTGAASLLFFCHELHELTPICVYKNYPEGMPLAHQSLLNALIETLISEIRSHRLVKN